MDAQRGREYDLLFFTMAKTKRATKHRGQRGLRGERGEPGPTGERGERGERGQRGERGDAGERGAGDARVGVLVDQVEGIRKELKTQFQRFSQVQQQLDDLTRDLKKLQQRLEEPV